MTGAPDSTPRVSVVILNYKRVAALKRCLDSVLSQNYSRLEVIVVDNHSEEDLGPALHGTGGRVRLIELPENSGACAGRNAGIRQAGGDVIVTLDNDVRFASAFEIQKLVRAFADHPDIHVLAFQVCCEGSGKLRIREWCHPRNWKRYGSSEFETDFFGEGASAFRAPVFREAGLYYEPLFIGHEGHDLGLRILDCGFRILYCPEVRVFHDMSPETRLSGRAYYMYTRNYIWIAHKNYSGWIAFRFLASKLAMMLTFSVRDGHCFAFARGVRDAVRGLPMVHRHRTLARHQTLAHIRTLEKFRPNWLFRLARHCTKTEI